MKYLILIILYKLTGIRFNVPVTYLKREIPLLSYYTPEVAQGEKENIYLPTEQKDNTQLLQLKFDLNLNNDNLLEEREKIREDISRESATSRRPTIAIYHSHTSETYIDDPRPQDINGHVRPGEIGNVAQIGQELSTILSNKYNFQVIHNTRVHDENYARSYYNSRKTVKELISSYPDLDLILDIHRDGIKDISPKELTTEINGEEVAQIMILVTTGQFGFAHLDLPEHHPDWQKNLDFAHLLADNMEKMYPGLLRRIEMRDTTYNQDLHPRALLLEIGDYRNTTQEALRSARLLADVIAAII